MMNIYDATEQAYKNGYARGFADAKAEWISVNDRLPTDEGYVLAYYGFDHGDDSIGMPFIGTLCYFAYDPNPHWQHESVGLRVTHWMPLPELPKGE